MSIQGVGHFYRGFRLLCLRFWLRGTCLSRWHGYLYSHPRIKLMVESVLVGGDFNRFAWVVERSTKRFQILLVDACMDGVGYDLYCHCIYGFLGISL